MRLSTFTAILAIIFGTASASAAIADPKLKDNLAGSGPITKGVHDTKPKQSPTTSTKAGVNKVKSSKESRQSIIGNYKN
jgi:hypothetical protein